MSHIYALLVMILLVSPAHAGPWKASTYTDPLNDSKEYSLSITSNDGVNKFGKRAMLTFWCTSGDAGLSLKIGEYLADDHAQIIMRLDKQEAEISYWLVDSEHTGAIEMGDVNSDLRKISKASRLTIQAYPYMEAPRVFVFNVTGFEPALTKLLPQCGTLDISSGKP